MNITLTPDIQERIERKIREGEYETADALVLRALDWVLDIDDEDELEETRAAIDELRAKYGIPR